MIEAGKTYTYHCPECGHLNSCTAADMIFTGRFVPVYSIKKSMESRFRVYNGRCFHCDRRVHVLGAHLHGDPEDEPTESQENVNNTSS